MTHVIDLFDTTKPEKVREFLETDAFNSSHAMVLLEKRLTNRFSKSTIEVYVCQALLNRKIKVCELFLSDSLTR